MFRIGLVGGIIMSNEQKRVAIYARVSSDKQDTDLSISAQLRALREYAERNKYQVIREFVDEAETGRTTARPAFREMISLSRRLQKPFETILVWKYSRFARSREDSIVHKAMLRKNGIQVVSINEPFDDTPTGRLLEAIIESLDEFYSDNLGEEVTRGMRESASRGFYLSARAPYGYRKVKVPDGAKERTKLEIEPYQVHVVTSLFDGVLQGKGLTEITKELNSKGIRAPRGQKWGKTSVRIILANEIYTGTYVWGQNNKRELEPISIENAFPAIVSSETFDEVQQKLKERAPVRVHPKRTASRFLLSGLARCGHCGKALIGADAKSGKFSYYVCGTLNKQGSGSCPSHYLNSAKFEGLVIDKIREHIITRENLVRLVSLVNEEMDSAAKTYQDELGAVSDEIINVSHRLEHLYDAIETGMIGLGDLAPRIQELRGRQKKLQARKVQIESLLSDRRVELASPQIVSRYVGDLRDLLANSSLTERRAFIKSFVKEVKVTGDEVLLTYTMPLPPKETSEEKVGVLSTVQYGGRYWT